MNIPGPCTEFGGPVTGLPPGGRSAAADCPTNHCILIMTDAYGVSPAIRSTGPACGEPALRLYPLAAHRARPLMSGRPASPATGVELVTTRD